MKVKYLVAIILSLLGGLYFVSMLILHPLNHLGNITYVRQSRTPPYEPIVPTQPSNPSPPISSPSPSSNPYPSPPPTSPTLVMQAPSEMCFLNFLIISAPRTTNPRYKYLDESLRSISELDNTILKPCVYIFNTEGDATKSEIEVAANHTGRIKVFKRNSQSDMFNRIFSDNPKKRKQTTDFYDMLETVQSMDINGPIALMEDDFTFCPDALSHLIRIIDFMNKKKDKWSGIRFSFGLNGIIIDKKDIPAISGHIETNKHRSFPIDWLLEEFFNRHSDNGREYFKDRAFYTYRFQIMQHIGFVTSVGNDIGNDQDFAFPHCNEPQTQSQLLFVFNMNACPNALFSPCENSTDSSQFTHDIPIISNNYASSRHSLSILHTVKPILCEVGQDCDKCCSLHTATCEPEFFEYINRCEELRKHYPTCECVRELTLQSRSPNFDGSVCVIGNRKSKFACSHSFYKERRLCPCKNKS